MRQEKPFNFQSVIKSKPMGTQVSINEEVPDHLLEREVDCVTSSVETEVSKYELATHKFSYIGLWYWPWLDDDICDIGNDF